MSVTELKELNGIFFRNETSVIVEVTIPLLTAIDADYNGTAISLLLLLWCKIG